MSLFVVVVVVGLFAALGLVVDGGVKLRAVSEADQLAGEAARAAGQVLDPAVAIGQGRARVDPDTAAAAAKAWLTRHRVTGTVTVSRDRRTITVTTRLTRPTVVLGLIGVRSVTVTGRASAQLLTTPTRTQGTP